MIFVCSNGPGWRDVPTLMGTRLIVADSLPAPGDPSPGVTGLRYARRISYAGATGIAPDLAPACPIGANVTADWFKSPNRWIAYDEVLVPQLTQPAVEWFESVLPAVGSNDAPGQPASCLILFVAGNPNAGPLVDRWLAAVAANPLVWLLVEGYHYETDGRSRGDDPAWLGRVRGRIPSGRLGLCLNLSHKRDATSKAYCAAGPTARDMDEDAVAEWMTVADHVGAWVAYATQESLWLGSDAVYRGLRRRYGVAP